VWLQVQQCVLHMLLACLVSLLGQTSVFRSPEDDSRQLLSFVDGVFGRHSLLARYCSRCN
jgi:hypothetical protein